MTEQKQIKRRALMAGAAGLAATALAKTTEHEAAAADQAPLRLGTTNDSTNVTTWTHDGSGAQLHMSTPQTGIQVQAGSTTPPVPADGPTAIVGQTDAGDAVRGVSQTGVAGRFESPGGAALLVVAFDPTQPDQLSTIEATREGGVTIETTGEILLEAYEPDDTSGAAIELSGDALEADGEAAMRPTAVSGGGKKPKRKTAKKRTTARWTRSRAHVTAEDLETRDKGEVEVSADDGAMLAAIVEGKRHSEIKVDRAGILARVLDILDGSDRAFFALGEDGDFSLTVRDISVEAERVKEMAGEREVIVEDLDLRSILRHKPESFELELFPEGTTASTVRFRVTRDGIELAGRSSMTSAAAITNLAGGPASKNEGGSSNQPATIANNANGGTASANTSNGDTATVTATNTGGGGAADLKASGTAPTLALTNTGQDENGTDGPALLVNRGRLCLPVELMNVGAGASSVEVTGSQFTETTYALANFVSNPQGGRVSHVEPGFHRLRINFDPSPGVETQLAVFPFEGWEEEM